MNAPSKISRFRFLVKLLDSIVTIHSESYSSIYLDEKDNINKKLAELTATIEKEIDKQLG